MNKIHKVVNPVLSILAGVIMCDIARNFIPNDSVILWTITGLCAGTVFTGLIARNAAWLCGAIVGVIDAAIYIILIYFMWSNSPVAFDFPITWGSDTFTTMLGEPFVGLVVATVVSHMKKRVFILWKRLQPQGKQ